MKKIEKKSEQRYEKIAEKQHLEKRKSLKDKRYHVIDDDTIIEQLEKDYLHQHLEEYYD